MWRGIPVAVKRFHDVLRQEALRVSDYYNKLFRQELSTCAKLHHPNIVTFCGATLEKDTPLQIVMELLEGSLEELIQVAKGSDFYLTHREQVHLAEGTTAGITYLHQLQPKPYVHCDIRPSNILVSRDMSAKVGDLGASHIVGASTSAGPLSGNYIAPERMGGEGQRSESSPSSDVYSLGVTLTDLFTGEAAVPSKRDQQLAMIANEYLQDLCIEATLAIPGERPSAAHMLVRLQQQKSANEFLCCPIRRLVLGKVEGDRMRLVAMQ
jgi:serine/threonine protein kinase